MYNLSDSKTVQKVLEKHGFHFSKSLGQNFLINPTVCPRMADCRTYKMWKGLNDLISDYFGKITLADLAAPDQAGNDYII